MRRLVRECRAFVRLFFTLHRRQRQVVFYAERAIDFQYFEGLISTLLRTTDLRLCYLTSDEEDPILRQQEPRMAVLHFNALLPFVIPLLDARVLVMTMPDLHTFHIRRSARGAHHLYVFHALVSTHMVYRMGAFDHYDSILCAGPHHVEELRRTERLRGLPSKHLVTAGYPRLDRIITDHHQRPPTTPTVTRKHQILIAPSWGRSNILETGVQPMVDILIGAGYDVTIRPHPELIKRKPDVIDQLTQLVKSRDGIDLELDLLSDRSLHEADVLITDWSGIALEYAFGTERPVLFIDVPRRVSNPDYETLGLEPLEVLARREIGLILSPRQLQRLPQVVRFLIDRRSLFLEKIRHCRSNSVYNLGASAEISAAYIRQLCEDDDQGPGESHHPRGWKRRADGSDDTALSEVPGDRAQREAAP